ncbi:MAG: hypothetical protein F9K43_14705 [Bauldia sp.]|nr:MAG: hypothetical protein F9K43_14705 [Bauldia sp.]
MDNLDDRTEGATREPLAPLVALVAAIDEADLLNLDLPLERPGLLEGFLDPEVQTALPAELRAAADAYLDGLPKGVFLTPIFYGPTVLVLSGQSVLGAPYHRGGDAILATIRATEGSPDEARAVMLAHGVAYVAFCATAPDVAETAAEAPDGLLAVLLRGDAPSWLEPLPAHQGSMLRVFRVASPP